MPNDLLQQILEDIYYFDDWDWCECMDCRFSITSHGINTLASMSVLANQLREKYGERIQDRGLLESETD